MQIKSISAQPTLVTQATRISAQPGDTPSLAPDDRDRKIGGALETQNQLQDNPQRFQDAPDTNTTGVAAPQKASIVPNKLVANNQNAISNSANASSYQLNSEDVGKSSRNNDSSLYNNSGQSQSKSTGAILDVIA